MRARRQSLARIRSLRLFDNDCQKSSTHVLGVVVPLLDRRKLMAKPFKGVINLDVRDSTPDWSAFLADRAPKDAPNVLIILFDDTGQAAWSPYGGRINMPTLDRLAANGLTYTQWHTTALCSP